MHWLVLGATRSRDADASLRKELTHNFIWVKKAKQNP